EEGCLSLPGAYMELARPDYAKVEAQDLDGAPVTFAGTGMFARCLQHETDHCNGTVFGDRLNRRRRKKLHRTAEELDDRYPADWPATPGRSSLDATT
ncbi:MAG: peptide deformylase, partial [Nocardioidaceae bacterium]